MVREITQPTPYKKKIKKRLSSVPQIEDNQIPTLTDDWSIYTGPQIVQKLSRWNFNYYLYLFQHEHISLNILLSSSTLCHDDRYYSFIFQRRQTISWY